MCLERERERERERESIFEMRKKKCNIQMNSHCVNIHGYCNNYRYLHHFNLMDVGNFKL